MSSRMTAKFSRIILLNKLEMGWIYSTEKREEKKKLEDLGLEEVGWGHRLD